MRVLCTHSFTKFDLPSYLRDARVMLPQAEQIYHVVSSKTEEADSGYKPGLYYTLAESDGTVWYHAERFRRITDISALQALTVVKTKTKVLEEV